MKKILIYGYGNPGRQDDGLGERFINLMDQWIAEEKIDNVFTDCNYQLNIEDSATIADYDTVIFVDASVADVDNYKLEKVSPNDATIEFTMHAVSVSYVLDLCQKIYHKQPETYVLHIKAYEFDFVEALTPQAEENLLAAFEFLKRFIQQI
ncbi:MAG TPA: hydrogenase maturation protease [Bacteroidales bacterium]|nr:hydrogenase maturation protease [Bacteroidales bacterium]HPB25672.1 hydrogenase maturation protease [Bacteroidales bacterium]HPI30343.1 hydrogenase maturation protease [Bacteroidales bacterium]HQN16300.1 hydrogenase maturation protease [Bacteroidales bacterium]